MAHTLKWFVNRIGKRIYRDADGCKCQHCANVVENGLIVSNKQHAQYIQEIESGYEAEGIKLNYRDSKICLPKKKKK